MDDPAAHQMFGFDDPDPSIGEEGVCGPSKMYGYEFWITVEDDSRAKVIEVRTVGGGLFEVRICGVEGPVDIGKTWGLIMDTEK